MQLSITKNYGKMKAGTIVIIRLYTYKSFRHYGGREITETPAKCKASFIADQVHTKVVTLLEDCAGFKRGYKIAVDNKDFNLN